jgi:hypothetical protein
MIGLSVHPEKEGCMMFERFPPQGWIRDLVGINELQESRKRFEEMSLYLRRTSHA